MVAGLVAQNMLIGLYVVDDNALGTLNLSRIIASCVPPKQNVSNFMTDINHLTECYF